MRVLARRAAVIAAGLALTPVLFASAAHADSLVYMKDGNVWISHGDGSNPRQVTGAPNTWSWPTEDDSGNILAAGGQESISGGVEDTAGSEVYRLNQQGANLSAPQQTPGSMSTVSCPTYPPVGLRVAPDGQHYVYHSWFCDHNIVEIGTVGGQGFTSSDYIEDMVFPTWVDNSEYLVSRGGDPGFGTCDPGSGQYTCEWGGRTVGQQVNYWYPWSADSSSSATGFDGEAISRDGTKFATVEDDGADYLGAAHNVELRLFTATGVPGPSHDTMPAPTFKCSLSLPADPQSTLWYYNANPSFSPDGTKLAFAEPDGVHVANVASLATSCAAISAPLVIPDATQPFWSAADEAANAGYVAPGGTGGGGGGSVTPDKTAPVLGSLSIRPKRFAVAKSSTALSARKKRSPQGATIRYTLSEPARVSFVVERSIKGHKKGRACKRSGRGRPCVLLVRMATLTRSGLSGSNQLAFSGRLGSRKLSPGSYKLVVSAVDAAGNRSATKTVSFTIVSR